MRTDPRLLSLLLAVSALWLPACRSNNDSTKAGPVELGTTDQALRTHLGALAPGEVLLDANRSSTLLAARVLPAPTNAGPKRLLSVRWLDGSPAGEWALSSRPILDVQFVPNTDGAVVLTAAQELVWLESKFAEPAELDESAYGPLSVSEDGRFVSYVRGEPPDVEVVRLDLQQRSAELLTHDLAPCWNPTLSADGHSVLFVSGATGSPELWRVDGNAKPVQLTRREGGTHALLPFPSGPGAAKWLGDTLVFQDTAGVHVLSVPTLRLIRSYANEQLPVVLPSVGELLLQQPAGLRSVPLTDLTEVAQ